MQTTTDRFPVLRHHWIALVLAVIVGALCVSPQLYFASHAPGFSGVQMMGSDAEDHYTARINQVYQGFTTISDAFLPLKDGPYLLPGLGENIVARVGMSLSISAPEANVLSKFLFPLLATLAVYSLAFVLFRSRAAAIVSSAFVMLGDGLISGPSAWLALLHGASANGSFLVYARPINPEISGLFLFAALFLLYRTFLNDQRPHWRLVLLSGALVGGALYVSPFVFSFLVAVHVLLFIRSLYRRDKQGMIGIIGVGAATAVLMIPFVLNYLRLQAAPAYADTVMRGGVAMSHLPIVGYWIPIMLALAIFFMPKKYRNTRLFFIIGAGALLIVLNQQIITGRILQPGHYHWYITTPLIQLLLGGYAVMLCQKLLRARMARYAAYTLCIAALLYNGATTQAHAYAQAYPSAAQDQRYGAVLDYLSTLQNRQFIWADKYISVYIPIYTVHNAANNRQIPNYLVPNSYLERTMLLQYRLRGIKPADILDIMKAEREEVSSIVYSLYWRNNAGSFAAIPDPILESFAKDYAQEYAQPIRNDLTDLGITMIVWDKTIEPEWKISSLPFAEKIYSSGSIDVFSIK